MAYLKHGGLKKLRFVNALYLLFYVLLQTGQNGQRGLEESRGLSEINPTCGQILPILQKLQTHCTVKEDGQLCGDLADSTMCCRATQWELSSQ